MGNQVVVNGAGSELGRAAIAAVTKARGMQLVGAVDSQFDGQDAGQVLLDVSASFFTSFQWREDCIQKISTLWQNKTRLLGQVVPEESWPKFLNLELQTYYWGWEFCFVGSWARGAFGDPYFEWFGHGFGIPLTGTFPKHSSIMLSISFPSSFMDWLNFSISLLFILPPKFIMSSLWKNQYPLTLDTKENKKRVKTADKDSAS